MRRHDRRGTRKPPQGHENRPREPGKQQLCPGPLVTPGAVGHLAEVGPGATPFCEPCTEGSVVFTANAIAGIRGDMEILDGTGLGSTSRKVNWFRAPAQGKMSRLLRLRRKWRGPGDSCSNKNTLLPAWKVWTAPAQRKSGGFSSGENVPASTPTVAIALHFGRGYEQLR